MEGGKGRKKRAREEKTGNLASGENKEDREKRRNEKEKRTREGRGKLVAGEKKKTREKENGRPNGKAKNTGRKNEKYCIRRE